MRTKPGLKPQLSTPDVPPRLHAALAEAVTTVLAKLRDDTIHRLRVQARVIHRTPHEAVVAAGSDVGDQVAVDNPLSLFSPTDWSNAVGSELGPLIGATVVDAANSAVIGASFDVSDPNMAAAVTDHVQQMQDWGPAIQFQVANTVQVGMTEGWSVDRMAIHLSDAGALSDTAAQQIAHDTALAASNAGTITSWKDAGGVQTKSWLATDDDRTRDSHVEAGQTQVDIPIDQPFEVGGEQCDYPGDPSLSPAQAANCRCTMTAGLADENAPPDEASVDTGAEAETAMAPDLLSAAWGLVGDDGAIEDRPAAIDAFVEAAMAQRGAMPSDLRATVVNYTGSGYEQVNNSLRDLETARPNVLEKIQNLDAAFEGYSAALARDATLYRGLSQAATAAAGGWKPGQVIMEPAFMSTSMGTRRAENFSWGVMLHINAPAGTRYLVGDGGESELILNRGSLMKIGSIEKTDKGTVVTVDVVQ